MQKAETVNVRGRRNDPPSADVGESGQYARWLTAEDANRNPDHGLSGCCERARTLDHRMGEVNAQK